MGFVDEVNKIIGYKGQWEHANAQGDTKRKEQIRQQAEISYRNLEAMGYGSAAQTLRNSNYSQAIRNASIYPGSFSDYYNNSGYKANSANYRDSARAAMDAYAARATIARNTAEKSAQEAAKKAYIAYMNSSKNMPQQMAAAGLTGGVAQSNMLRSRLNYENNISEIEREKNAAISGIEAGLADYVGQTQMNIANQEADDRKFAYNQYMLELEKQRERVLEEERRLEEQEKADLERRINLAYNTGNWDIYEELTGMSAESLRQADEQQRKMRELEIKNMENSLQNNNSYRSLSDQQGLDDISEKELNDLYYALVNGEMPDITPQQELALKQKYDPLEIEGYMRWVSDENSDLVLKGIVDYLNNKERGSSNSSGRGRITYDGSKYIVPRGRYDDVLEAVCGNEIFPAVQIESILTKFNIPEDYIRNFLSSRSK